MRDFSCWFCKGTIKETDVKAVSVEVSNLWSDTADFPRQTLYAHSDCATTYLSGAYRFDPEDLREPQ